MDLFTLAARPGRPAASGAIATLRANLSRLPEGDRAFAQSLLDCRNRLSGKQTAWVERLARRAIGAEPAPVSAAEGLGPIVDLLDMAALKLKWPVIRFAAGDLGLRLGRSGPSSREPGAVNVTSDHRRFDERIYYGRISRAGGFEPNPGRPEAATAITTALTALAAAPAREARLYGQRFGTCCFCGLELTDGRSIAAGYGPICADKWGLPWGG